MADVVDAPDEVPSTIGQPMVVGPTANDDKEEDRKPAWVPPGSRRSMENNDCPRTGDEDDDDEEDDHDPSMGVIGIMESDDDKAEWVRRSGRKATPRTIMTMGMEPASVWKEGQSHHKKKPKRSHEGQEEPWKTSKVARAGLAGEAPLEDSPAEPSSDDSGYSSCTSDDATIEPPQEVPMWPRNWTLDQRAHHVEMVIKRKKEWLVDTLLKSVFRHFDQNYIVERFEIGILNKLNHEGLCDDFWDRHREEIGEDIVKGAMSAVQAFAGTHDISIVLAENLSILFKMCYVKALAIESILDEEDVNAWMSAM